MPQPTWIEVPTCDELGDLPGAIADYNKAIEINPNHADAYNNRGNTRYKLGDQQRAIAEHNKAIEINPNYADAYYNRGAARNALGDNQSAIADMQKAAQLFQQQGNTQLYQEALELITRLESISNQN